MSCYKPKGSPFYHFDFWWRGHRFHGTTKRTNRREAEAVEQAEREHVRQRAATAKAVTTSLKLDDVAGRYWTEVGQHHAGAKNTWRDLGRLVDYFGPSTMLTEITADDVARLVAWRRGHRVLAGARKDAPVITNATVNRSTTEMLKKLFTRAKAWGVRFDHEPGWKQYWLEEPEERVRELVGDEGDRLEDAARDDYLPLLRFAHESGLRLTECVYLKWSEIDWEARLIRKLGKGRKMVTVPITSALRAILWPLRGHDPDRVFTYIAQRTRASRVKGVRYPITFTGAKTEWKRTRKRAGVFGFRFHDYRHDMGTKLLRETGNLKLVQKALNHADIRTTSKYAHVLTDEIAEAMERVTESRKKSRSSRRKVV